MCDDVGPPATGDVPVDIAQQIVRSLDQSPSTVAVLVGDDLRTRWVSQSAAWLAGIDPASRAGQGSFDHVHPDDAIRLLHGFDQLKRANEASPGVPVVEPIRYRFGTGDDWVMREALVVNMLHDPAVRGLLLILRPVEGELDGVGHVVDLLMSEAPLPDVLGATASLVPRHLGGAAVVAVLATETVVGVARGRDVDGLASDPRWWEDGLADGVARTPDDFAGFPHDLADKARAEGFHTAWVLPLTYNAGRDVMGCVVAWLRIEVRIDMAIDQGLLQTKRLSTMVIGGVRRRNALREAALTDPLTGVANRSALRRRLDEAGAAASVTVVFVDLDDFKAVNDNYGHDAGDKVLTTVAERLTAAVREDDLVVRLGGDEFAVVLAAALAPDPQPDDGAAERHAGDDPEALARRMQAAVEGPLHLGPTLIIPVHASVGVATGRPRDVVRAADASLYEAKRAKRSAAG